MTVSYPYTPPVSPVLEGTTVRFYTLTPFTAVDGTVMDPDRVIFAWNVGGEIEGQVEYNVAGLWTIVRTSAGHYYVEIDTTGYSGLWTYSWVGLSVDGAVQTRDEQKLLVKPGEVTVTL